MSTPEINGHEVGGGSASVAPAAVARVFSVRWSVEVLVGELDVSSMVTGDIEIRREEGAAAVATFSLRLPGPYRAHDWRGRPVSIAYADQHGQGTRFGGVVALPRWQHTERVLTLECSDQRQARIEAMSIEQVAQAIPGVWHEDVFSPLDGRSPFDYAQELLSTLPASADYSVDGELRVSSWFAKPSPDWFFGEGSTLYRSFAHEAADTDSIINVAEVAFEYRFPRRWQQVEYYSWQHPAAVAGGQAGFLDWLAQSSELPDVSMIADATRAAGLTRLATGSYYVVPPTGVYDTGGQLMTWRNPYYPNLLLGAAWAGARRWVQSVTEQITLRVVAPASVVALGEQVSQTSLGVDVESAAADAWGATPFGIDTPRPVSGTGIAVGEDGIDYGRYQAGGYDNGFDGYADDRDSERRDAVIAVLLQRAAAEVVRSHRGDRASFDVPVAMALGVDLPHTVALADQGVELRGKVFSLRDLLSPASGSAVTTITVALMSGWGGDSDALTPPVVDVAPDLPAGPEIGLRPLLPTQLGGYPSSPDHDPDMLGFSGNYSDGGSASQRYPRQMRIAVAPVSAALTDEQLCPVVAEYALGIPDDVGRM